MPPRPEIEGQEELFPSGEFETGARARYKPLSARLWTQNKAQLIARYLREFVFVTKHGTCIASRLKAATATKGFEPSFRSVRSPRKKPPSA